MSSERDVYPRHLVAAFIEPSLFIASGGSGRIQRGVDAVGRGVSAFVVRRMEDGYGRAKGVNEILVNLMSAEFSANVFDDASHVEGEFKDQGQSTSSQQDTRKFSCGRSPAFSWLPHP